MAIITVSGSQSISAALASAKVGDTIQLAASTTWTLTGSFTIPTGVTLKGAPDLSSKLIFHLSGQDLIAIIIAANASNVTIQWVDITSSNGAIKMMDGNGYHSIYIFGCNLSFGGGSFTSGQAIFGITATIGCTDLRIQYNYFHDSLTSVRNWEVWNQIGYMITNNEFYNVADGGHIVNPGSGGVFDHNYGTYMKGKGQEIQSGLTGATGLKFTNNVFYYYIQVNNESEGMSVCPSIVSDVLVDGNYINLNFAPGAGWGTPTPGSGANRFGPALESMAPGIVVSNNTLILGQTCFAGVMSGMNTTMTGNSIYDASPSHTQYTAYTTEPGPSGTYGTISATGDHLLPIASATAAPANTFAGPAFLPGSTPVVVPPPVIVPPPVVVVPPRTVAKATLVVTFTDGVTQTLNLA